MCRTWIPDERSASTRDWNAVLSRWAPSEPPVTSSVGHWGSSPKFARPSSRRAARSSSAISRRSGMPTTVAPRRAVEAKVVPTWRVKRAPRRFAMPARAFCSCTTMGMRRLRAARYAGVET